MSADILLIFNDLQLHNTQLVNCHTLLSNSYVNKYGTKATLNMNKLCKECTNTIMNVQKYNTGCKIMKIIYSTERVWYEIAETLQSK